MNFIQAFRNWFRANVVKWDVTRGTNRDLRVPGTNEVKVLKVLIPTVRLNPDTGEMENWDTWTAPQTFQGDAQFDGDVNIDGDATFDDITTENITITTADRIIWLGTANTYIDYDAAGEQLRFYIDGNLACTIGIGPILHLPMAQSSIAFGDGDTGIQETSDDVLDTDIATNLVQRINAAGVEVTGEIHATTNIHATGDLESGDDVIVGDDVVLGIGQRVTLDDDADSYIYAHQDDQVRFYTGGGLSFLIDNTGSAWYNGFNMQGNRINNLLAIQFDETTKPTAVAGHGILYVKASGAVQKLYFLQEDGTEKEVAFV